MRSFFPYPSHGSCWLWDFELILLHSISSLGTFLAYMVIPLVILYIYRNGHLNSIEQAFPVLWRLGAGFIFLCGLSHLGSFLEIYFGGKFYWITGVFNMGMAVVSLLFVCALWKCKDDLVLLGKIFTMISEAEQDQQEKSTKGES